MPETVSHQEHSSLEQPDASRPIQTDVEFRSRVNRPETFRADLAGRPLVLQLEQVKHSTGEQNVLEHTRQVLLHLRTDVYRDIQLPGVTMKIPELMRRVSLYHDADKALDTDGGKPRGKKQGIERAMAEIRAVDPNFFQMEADEKVFRFFLQTCDYFGYNTRVLERTGDTFRSELAQLLEMNLLSPLEALAEEGIDIDVEVALRIQHELSRADTLGIPKFQKNVGNVDRLLDELTKALSY